MGGPANTHSSENNAPRRESRPILQRVHAWRERIRRNPASRLALKLVTGLVGTAVLIAGLIMVPFPGPGWLVVILGLAILASEFAWAQHLLQVVRSRVRAWTHWVGEQSLPVRLAVGLATCVFVAGVVYLMAVLFGVPAFVPDALVPPLPGLESA